MKMGLILASVMTGVIASGQAYANPGFFKNMTASYIVKYDDIPIGKSLTTLKITDKNQYLLCIDNKATLPFLKASLKECSQGMIDTNDIRPLSYHYFYQRDQHYQLIQIDFNWKNHVATVLSHHTRWHLSFPDHIQDKISYQLLLRRALFHHQKDMRFPLADGGKVKIYHYRVIKTEKLDTPWKTVNTIRLERLPISDKENVTLWLMPDHDFIVAKAEQSKHIINVGTAEIEYAQI